MKPHKSAAETEQNRGGRAPLLPPMSSSSAPQSSNSNAGGQWFPANKTNSSSAAGASLMLSAILSLIFVVIVISIHIYTRYRRQYESDGVITIIHSSNPSNRPAAAAAAAAAVSKGLDASAIEKLPTFPYRRPENGGGAAECAVCLCVAEEGEMVRMLPECKHLFHVGCIDMWLYSHSTCPVCRGEAKVLVTKFVFGEMVAAPRLPERVGGGGGGGCVVEAPEGSSESQRRWVMMVDGERDLERQ